MISELALFLGLISSQPLVQEEVRVVHRIDGFDRGSVQIPDAAKEDLETVARRAIDYHAGQDDTFDLVLTGHAQSDESANAREIADGRAQAVRQYLISRGVSPKALLTKAIVDKSQPVGNDPTARFVEFNVLEKPAR